MVFPLLENTTLRPGDREVLSGLCCNLNKLRGPGGWRGFFFCSDDKRMDAISSKKLGGRFEILAFIWSFLRLAGTPPWALWESLWLVGAYLSFPDMELVNYSV
jgi:hypothetical protein